MNEADLQYGPTPPGAEHEHTDIEPSLVGRFALWLMVAVLISAAIVYGTFWLFEGRAASASAAARVFPLAAGQTREPATPRLQTQPFKDVYQLKTSEAERLHSYGWVDQGAGVVHMPIEDALRVLSERGDVPSRMQAATGFDDVVQDSSGGRTRAGRPR